MTTTVVHEWCGFVDKANVVVHKQMVLNKLWIPDVLIDIIKDYLFISAEVVLRKYYINKIMSNLLTDTRILRDKFGQDRIISWRTKHALITVKDYVYVEGAVCTTCGESSRRHRNNTGCCLKFGEYDDGEDLGLEVVDVELSDETIFEINNEPD